MLLATRATEKVKIGEFPRPKREPRIHSASPPRTCGYGGVEGGSSVPGDFHLSLFATLLLITADIKKRRNPAARATKTSKIRNRQTLFSRHERRFDI